MQDDIKTAFLQKYGDIKTPAPPFSHRVDVFLVRLSLSLLFLSSSSPHDGFGLILFPAEIVSVGETGSPHHFPAHREREETSRRTPEESMRVT